MYSEMLRQSIGSGRAILLISEHRMSDAFEMYSHLMCSAGMQ